MGADVTMALTGAPSVDHDLATHALRMVWHDFDHPGQHRAEVLVPVEQIAEFIQAVTRAGTQALTGAALALSLGDCQRCGNTRLIEVDKSNGRTERVHCPDCWRPVTPFADVPKVGYHAGSEQ